MMLRSVLFVFLSIFISTTHASNFYVGVAAGIADHESTLDLINTSLDPVLGFDFEKDFQAPADTALAASLTVGYKLSRDLALEIGYTRIEEIEGEKRTFIDICIPPGTASSPCLDAVDDLGTNLYAEEQVKTDFMSVSFVGQWPIHSRWAFHAKLGVAAWKYKYTQVLTNIDSTALELSRAAGGCPAPDPCPAPIPNPIQFPLTVDPASYDPTLVSIDEFRTESYSDTGIDFIYGMGIGYGVSKTFEIRLDVEAHSFNPQFININVDADLLIVSLGLVTHF